MTLLDASTTLVDAVRQLPAADDPRGPLAKSIRRMERRIQVLRLRAAKARKLRRSKAWLEAQEILPSSLEGNQAIVVCPKCLERFNFGDFVRTAEITGHGIIKLWICTKCDWPMIGLPVCDDDESARLTSPEEPWLPRHILEALDHAEGITGHPH